MNLLSNFLKRTYLVFFLFLTTLVLVVSCSPGGKIPEEIDISYLFGPTLPGDLFSPEEKANQSLINLGRMLYYDKRLSQHHDVSCNTCHQLDNYGVDNKPLSAGHAGEPIPRNAPTVYHAAAHIAQFWDGRAENVEEADIIVTSSKNVLSVIESIPGYIDAFSKAFPRDSNPITYENAGKAIGAFSRGLVTPSPFDKYFAGDKKALTRRQKRGLVLFVDIGCATCHSGTYFGGQLYRKVGLVRPWPNQEDQGRYSLTKQDIDRMTFKVSALRNVAKTPPYYHDGSLNNLEGAVSEMARNQLGKDLPKNQIQDIAAFLESLTGELPMSYIKEPKLPESTDKTPKSDSI
jgi:cytochrome c peroxidase